MDSEKIVSILNEMARILELLDENPFKVNAHRNAARAIGKFDGDLGNLAQEGKLSSIKGVGKGIAEKITDAVEHGESSELVDLRAKIPPGIFDILKIRGLGAKKVRKLWRDLGIVSLGELEYACNENRLAELDGFGEKSQQSIINAVREIARNAGKKLLPQTIRESVQLLEIISLFDVTQKIEISGDVRRRLEMTDLLTFLVVTSSVEKFIEQLKKIDIVESVELTSRYILEFKLESGLRGDIRFSKTEIFVKDLFISTGSAKHLEEIGAEKLGNSVFASEEDIYENLGLRFIEPELREEGIGLKVAKSNSRLNLVKRSNIKGVFHNHSKYSDGWATIEEMALACKELGLTYLGMADHSQTSVYAGGLTPDDIARQSDEIDALNESMEGFTIFKGIEADILPDGSLDYNNDILSKLDFVVASVHSGFSMGEKEMTDRIEKAVRNRNTTMLGHMTGRLLLARDGYRLDISRIIKAAGEEGVVIELNANPRRLDIDWRFIPEALAQGVKISINPDAHRPTGLSHIDYGVMIARKGGATAEDIINCLDAEEVAGVLKKRRQG